MERRSQFAKLPHFGSCPAPLFEAAHAQAPSQPLVYFGDRTIIFRDSEVVYPAAEVFGKLCAAPASFGRYLAVPPLPSAGICVNVSTISLTGFSYRDFHPISVRPCRAYTRESSRLVTLAADFYVSRKYDRHLLLLRSQPSVPRTYLSRPFWVSINFMRLRLSVKRTDDSKSIGTMA